MNASNLTLIQPGVSFESVINHPRPFKTYYYATKETDNGFHVRIGRASTDIGAIRAAVVNILIGKYQSADIYGADDIRRYLIRFNKGNLSIIGYFKHIPKYGSG